MPWAVLEPFGSAFKRSLDLESAHRQELYVVLCTDRKYGKKNIDASMERACISSTSFGGGRGKIGANWGWREERERECVERGNWGPLVGWGAFLRIRLPVMPGISVSGPFPGGFYRAIGGYMVDARNVSGRNR